MIPADADLTARPDEIRAWDDVPDDLKPILARQMEVYAGFLEHTDHHVGRLIDAVDDLGVLDDTLVYYVIGDNGASAEGTPNGTFNEMLSLNGAGDFETLEFLTAHIDDFGTPEAYNHYAVGWAHAMCTPYQWTKQVASHFGGTRNGTIVHWPNGFASRGEVRSQFHHVIDIAATVLDAAGIPEPQTVNGVDQQPLHGVSMRYCFDDDAAAERRETQYFEMLCNRGMYHQGWTAVTRHSVPWMFGAELPPLDDDVWELYDTTTDWTQAHDLVAEHPEKLAALQRLFLIEAVKYQVLPLDDRRIERFNSELAGRPILAQGPSQLLFGGMGRLTENSVLNLKNKSYSVTADVVDPRRRGQRRHRRPGRRVRRLVALPARRRTGALLQPAGPGPLEGRWHRAPRRRSAPGARGVHLRRRRPRQGWRGRAARRRHPGRHGPPGGERPHAVLGGRDPRPRLRHRHIGQRRLRPARRATSPDTSTGSSSTRAPTTTRTSSHRRSASASPWSASRTATRPPGRSAESADGATLASWRDWWSRTSWWTARSLGDHMLTEAAPTDPDRSPADDTPPARAKRGKAARASMPPGRATGTGRRAPIVPTRSACSPTRRRPACPTWSPSATDGWRPRPSRSTGERRS